MDPLELEFERRLLDAIRTSINLGYNPIRITEMIETRGGKGTAIDLVGAGEIQEGLRRIVEMDHRELSVESIMLEAQFAPLFENRVLAAARWRLDRAEELVREGGE